MYLRDEALVDTEEMVCVETPELGNLENVRDSDRSDVRVEPLSQAGQR